MSNFQVPKLNGAPKKKRSGNRLRECSLCKRKRLKKKMSKVRSYQDSKGKTHTLWECIKCWA